MLCVNANVHQVYFKDILQGQVFKHGGYFCLKIEPIELLDAEYNIVYLDKGTPAYFGDTELVENVSGAFVVGYKQGK